MSAPVGMFSTRALDSSGNQNAGNRLGTRYTADRILRATSHQWHRELLRAVQGVDQVGHSARLFRCLKDGEKVYTLLEDHQNEVLIEYRQFTLGRVTDIRADPVGDNSQDWIRFENEQLYFQSARSDHYASVRMQYWSTEPTEPQDLEWEKLSEVGIFNANNALAVWTITMGPANLQLDLEPGWYNLRAYCYGREAILRTDWEYAPGQDFPRSIERYFLQVWAAN